MPNATDPVKGGITPPPPVAPTTPDEAVIATETEEKSEDK